MAGSIFNRKPSFSRSRLRSRRSEDAGAEYPIPRQRRCDFEGAAPREGGPIALEAAGRLTFAGVRVERNADVSCAGAALAFAPGFAIEPGATLRCAVGGR